MTIANALRDALELVDGGREDYTCLAIFEVAGDTSTDVLSFWYSIALATGPLGEGPESDGFADDLDREFPGREPEWWGSSCHPEDMDARVDLLKLAILSAERAGV